MERQIALEKLQLLIGQDLWELAKQYPDLTLMNKEGKQQKGWAGHVIERYLQLPLNSAQSPNFGSWELKVIPLKFNRKGKLIVKETMAITMIDAVNVLQTPFEESHLLSKLRKQIVVARIDSGFGNPSIIHTVTAFDLDEELYQTVKADYELVQACLRDSTRGFHTLTGRMGFHIQPRTKGQKNTTTRAFYARKGFLQTFVLPQLEIFHLPEIERLLPPELVALSNNEKKQEKSIELDPPSTQE
ncbi:MAG: MutH/Sau3AI family endonuclease [Candidatus Melainabacteria bacterium]|jgi:DNA mismatch repair protein MutH|nr:MutH/Sau3AI family endonuclease [Candidatus Melainabacteria bacterium]